MLLTRIEQYCTSTVLMQFCPSVPIMCHLGALTHLSDIIAYSAVKMTGPSLTV